MVVFPSACVSSICEYVLSLLRFPSSKFTSNHEIEPFWLAAGDRMLRKLNMYARHQTNPGPSCLQYSHLNFSRALDAMAEVSASIPLCVFAKPPVLTPQLVTIGGRNDETLGSESLRPGRVAAQDGPSLVEVAGFHQWGTPKWMVYNGKSWKIL